jgi:phenylpropionate dioxygenase-like ring-hydroxylating dioxygenase large terminal subunit
MPNEKVDHWLPLEEAAAAMNRSLMRIKSHMRNGRIQRDRHFRRVGEGQFELNVTEYLEWLKEEKEQRKLPLMERVRRSIEDGDKRLVEAVTEARAKAPAPTPAPTAAPTADARRARS